MAMNREALPAESELSEQAGSLYVVPNAPELPEEIYQPSHGEHVSYNHDDIPELHPELLLKHRLGRVGRFLGKAALVGSIFVASGTAGMMIEGAPITVGPLHGNAKFTFDSYSSATFHDTQEHSATSVGLPFKAPSPLDGVGLGVHASLPNPLISITPTGIEPKIRDEKELKQKAALFANADQDVKADVWKMKEFFLLYGAIGEAGLMASVYGLNALKKRYPESLPVVNGLRIALAAGLITACAIPITIDKVSPPHGINISGEIAGLPPGVRVAGQMLKLIKNERRFGDTLIRHEKEAIAALSPLIHNKDVQIVELTEGFKCSQIMPRAAGALADDLHATSVVNAGDGAIGNSPLDPFCNSNTARQFRGHTVFEAKGQHDARGSVPGTIMLQGKVLTKDGLTILGDDDVMKYTAHGKQPDRAETREQMAARLANVACRQENGVNIFVTNESSETEQVITRGCADFVYAGGFNSQFIQQKVTATGREVNVYFTRGSGGAVYKNNANFGTAGLPQSVAEITLAGFYKTGHELTVVQSLLYYPDGTVAVEPPHLTALGEALLKYGNSPEKQRALQSYLAALAK